MVRWLGLARESERRWRGLAADAWLLLQQTAAAVLAWLIASRLAHHQDPFFAPIAAVVALNTTLGQRGSNAVRMVLGVVVGIVFGEIAVLIAGDGYSALALATFTAMWCARALDPALLVTAQAAAAAILTVATTGGAGGAGRLIDALIGAAIALAFSQLLFSPEPLRLVRRAESAALHDMAEGLRLTSDALDRSDEDRAERAFTRMHGVYGALFELARARRASGQVVRHSLLWRRRRAKVALEAENARNLDLLGGSCLVLARAVTNPDVAVPRDVAVCIRDLAQLLADLAQAPGDRKVRRRVAGRALCMAQPDAAGEKSLPISAAAAVQAVAADLLLVAGFRLDPPLEGPEDGRDTSTERE
jgi:hypothetical protein